VKDTRQRVGAYVSEDLYRQFRLKSLRRGFGSGSDYIRWLIESDLARDDDEMPGLPWTQS
jgi:hypothetical protein